VFDWLRKTEKKKPIKAKPVAGKGPGRPRSAETMDDRKRLVLLMREVRKKVSPDILARAREAAESQVPPEPEENEASRLWRLAHENDGAKRQQVLAFLEKKFKDKLD
jgi:hypothetical protein